jgi:hypothetical protein
MGEKHKKDQCGLILARCTNPKGWLSRGLCVVEQGDGFSAHRRRILSYTQSAFASIVANAGPNPYNSRVATDRASTLTIRCRDDLALLVIGQVEAGAPVSGRGVAGAAVQATMACSSHDGDA